MAQIQTYKHSNSKWTEYQSEVDERHRDCHLHNPNIIRYRTQNCCESAFSLLLPTLCCVHRTLRFAEFFFLFLFESPTPFAVWKKKKKQQTLLLLLYMYIGWCRHSCRLEDEASGECCFFATHRTQWRSNSEAAAAAARPTEPVEDEKEEEETKKKLWQKYTLSLNALRSIPTFGGLRCWFDSFFQQLQQHRQSDGQWQIFKPLKHCALQSHRAQAFQHQRRCWQLSVTVTGYVYIYIK